MAIPLALFHHTLSQVIPSDLLVSSSPHSFAFMPVVSHVLQILTFIFDFRFREMFAMGTQVFSKLICGHFAPECDGIWRQGPNEAEHS